MLFLDRLLLNWFIYVKEQFSNLVHGQASFQMAHRVIINLSFRTFIVLEKKGIKNVQCGAVNQSAEKLDLNVLN